MSRNKLGLKAAVMLILSFMSGCSKNYFMDPSYKREKHIGICLEENQPDTFLFKFDNVKKILAEGIKSKNPEEVPDSLSVDFKRKLPEPFILYKSKVNSATSIPQLSGKGRHITMSINSETNIDAQIWAKEDLEQNGYHCRYMVKVIKPLLSLRVGNPRIGPSIIVHIESKYLIYDYENVKVVAAGIVSASSLNNPGLTGSLIENLAWSLGDKIIMKSPFYDYNFNQDLHPQQSIP